MNRKAIKRSHGKDNVYEYVSRAKLIWHDVQATFTALNIESEEDTDDEVDDTKEIQVEEALKLYQNALKLHSQGPQYFDRTDAAYKELFASEIFAYPEALSEATRLKRYEDDPIDLDEDDDSDIPDVPLPIANNEGAQNSLPQILYLSHKNYGQFLLDRLTYGINQAHANGIATLDPRIYQASLAEAAGHFAEALERDESDSDLWRKLSRIAALISMKRISRFCLESVVSANDGSTIPIDRSDLDATLATDELLRILADLQDDLSTECSAGVLSSPSRLPTSLKKRMSLYAQMPQLPEAPAGFEDLGIDYPPQIIKISEVTWSEIGNGILQRGQTLVNEAPLGWLSAAVTFDYPQRESPPEYAIPNRHRTTQKAAVASLNDFPQTDSVAPLSSMSSPQEMQSTLIISPAPTGLAIHKALASENNVARPQDSSELSNAFNSTTLLNTSTAVINGAYEMHSREPNVSPRKRTSDAAGLAEGGDEKRERSKRIRARVETADEATVATEQASYFQSQLEPFKQADQWLSDQTAKLYESLSLKMSYNIIDIRDAIEDSKDQYSSNTLAMSDLSQILTNWDLNASTVFGCTKLPSDSVHSSIEKKNSGMALFLEFSRAGVQKLRPQPTEPGSTSAINFLRMINDSQMTIDAVAVAWIVDMLLARPTQENHRYTSAIISPYLSAPWPDPLKHAVTNILGEWDATLFSLLDSVDSTGGDDGDNLTNLLLVDRHAELVQTIFELHLDILDELSHPHKIVTEDMMVDQHDRLQRWSRLARRSMVQYAENRPLTDIDDPILLRHLWSIVISLKLTNAVPREELIFYFKDLKRVFEVTSNVIVDLPNNAAMTELSVKSIDREISALTTMDFFLELLNQDSDDSLAIIEQLEPLLFEFAEQDLPSSSVGVSGKSSAGMLEIRSFVQGASSTSRLMLWKRLRSAYLATDLSPMVLLCQIRIVDLILQDLSASAYTDELPLARSIKLLSSLHEIDQILGDHILESTRSRESDESYFTCLDDDHLHCCLNSLAQLISILQVFVVWEDAARVGQVMAPGQSGSGSSNAYETSLMKFRTMHVRAWLLQYFIIKDCGKLGLEDASRREEYADHLKLIHHGIGIRGYCKVAEKQFLHFLRQELPRLSTSMDTDAAIAQVIYDIWGFKVYPQFQGYEDHDCVAERLDRMGTLKIIDFVMKQAYAMNIKDLIKTDLKVVIEKTHAAFAKIAKYPYEQTLNSKLLKAYLKSPINPMELRRCLQGIGSLPIRPVVKLTRLARQGVFFMMGYMTFAKYHAQKRSSQASTEDVDVAIALFELDLTFDMEKWETWFRLAQAYDTKLEEEITYKSDKFTSSIPELNALQRKAIKCYIMAVAVAVRSADDTPVTVSKISDLFTDFGLRMYASSREPFSMQTFSLEEHMRYCNDDIRGNFTKKPFRELSLVPVWSFAALLFKQALIDKPRRWMNWYMLGKCLHKLRWYGGNDEYDARYIEAFTRAIECVPERRDSRHPEKDPVLEPHYKLVSVVHKLVKHRHLEPNEACEYLQATSYARKVSRIEERDDWEWYILAVLKALRSADKSNWHHRFIVRAAHVIYDESKDDIMAAHGAKHELTQQIFTKTMTIQVWRPENERAGRHFVYTSRYVEFFVELLLRTGDRTSIEALTKRIRKKGSEFVDHTKTWNLVCQAYLTLLRLQGGISSDGEERIFKPMPHSAYLEQTSLLETWLAKPDSQDHPILIVLREATELKKLNANLKKDTEIEDLVGDIVARIYEAIVPDLQRIADEAKAKEPQTLPYLDQPHLNPAYNNESRDATPGSSTAIEGQAPLGSDIIAPKPRAKLITRKEIQRRAEAIATKPAPTSAPAATMPAIPTPSKTIQVIIPILARPRTGSPSEVPLHDDDADDAMDEGATGEYMLRVEDEELGKDVPSSVPGSVHDSADDESESELSEIDEVEEMEEETYGGERESSPAQVPAPPPLFPGLLKRNTTIEDTAQEEDGDD
ncbi:Histone transcription regulator 3 [Agyrium rufum]|nr:Histone transcription regulator 3 [Agyrium rufum]